MGVDVLTTMLSVGNNTSGSNLVSENEVVEYDQGHAVVSQVAAGSVSRSQMLFS